MTKTSEKGSDAGRKNKERSDAGWKNGRNWPLLVFMLSIVLSSVSVVWNFVDFQTFIDKDALFLLHDLEKKFQKIKIVETSKYNQVSCPQIMTRSKLPNFYDPNKGMAESPKRRTITDPPFWISLFKEWFDRMRWNSIMKKGTYYEEGITDVFHQILSTTDAPGLVIDVGMNIGWFSLVARAHGHTVAAFDPNPVMHVRVCESLALNSWDKDYSVQTYQYGLGSEEAVLQLTTGLNPGGSSFHTNRLAKKHRKSFPVDVIKLDSVAEQEGWLRPNAHTIHLWKVDVEGFENNVFGGATNILASGKVVNILMENSSLDTNDVNSVLKLIYNNGYKVKTLLTVDGAPYHADKTDFINELLAHLVLDSMSKEEKDYTNFLVKATCNIWWVKRD